MVDIPGDRSTTATIRVGGLVSGEIEALRDHDWYRIDLTAGQEISVKLDGIGLEDAYLRILDANGNVLFENDDINPGIARDSLIAFAATYSGTYYIDVGAFDDDYIGSYVLSVDPYTPPPLWSIDRIADQLVSGYWGGDDHHFAARQGDTLTVNLTGLTAAGQSLAWAALALWSDVTGIKFSKVLTGGQITFDDNEAGAFSDGTWSNGIISSAHVNVSAEWLSSFGRTIDSYSFQTFVHEIGHALGLGHAGNYNGDARYPYEALFINDSWSTTVMSYFSQQDSSYFAGQGFSQAYVVTPMLADVVAMGRLYGLSANTRTGNTTYGYNSTADRDIFDAGLFPRVAYTIVDSGGIDTLDYSQSGADQRIDLNPESYSDVIGLTGNVAIARGTIIENARGGSGDDTLVGNSADNFLAAGAGDDTLDGGAGVDRMYGGLGNDSYTVRDTADYAYENAGEGTDQVVASVSHALRANIETLRLTGTASLTGRGNDLANSLYGNSGANKLYGLLGDDRLYGGEGNDVLDGGAGLDRLYGGLGNDSYTVSDATDYAYENAGEGTDRVYASVTHTLRANVEYLYLTGSSAIGGTGNDLANLLSGNAAANGLRGLAGDDKLYGLGGEDVLDGGLGDDWLEGGAGRDRMTGGTGADRFVFRDGDFASAVASGADQIHDFAQADGDRIRLDLVDADRTLGGDQAFAFIGTAAFSGAAGELRYAQVSGNTYLSGDTNGDGLPDFTIRLDGLHTLGTGDLVL